MPLLLIARVGNVRDHEEGIRELVCLVHIYVLNPILTEEIPALNQLIARDHA